MHSVLTRGNAIVAYTLTVLAVLTFGCFISTVFIDYRVPASMSTVKVVVYVFYFYICLIRNYSVRSFQCDLSPKSFNCHLKFLVFQRMKQNLN